MSEVALGPNEEDSAAEPRVERFEELWDRCAGAVYAFAARRIGADRAGDVVSETFIVAWRRFDEDRTIDLPWLYGVAHNVVRQNVRSANRFERLRAVSRPNGPARSAEADALVNIGVSDALASLSDLDGEIVLLAAWEGLNSKEIGRVVGLSPAAVRMRLSRAKRTVSTFNDWQEQDR